VTAIFRQTFRPMFITLMSRPRFSAIATPRQHDDALSTPAADIDLSFHATPPMD